jgi:hypothetical protein
MQFGEPHRIETRSGCIDLGERLVEGVRPAAAHKAGNSWNMPGSWLVLLVPFFAAVHSND